MINKNKNRGITLVALVITIIILLILAGITISSLTNTGLFGRAKEAKEKTQAAEENQSKILNEYAKELNKYTSTKLITENSNVVLSETENIELQDKNGSKIVVPAGFKVVVNSDTNNASTVDKGIVVEDNKGNQYVWIPCTTEESTSQLQYKRTEWRVESDENGTKASKDEETLTNEKCSADDIANGLTDEKVAEIVTQIKDEKQSISKYGGYYIGRYEIGNDSNVAVIKYNKTPYTEINWSKAYSLAKGIGGGTGATTYLCSSYAWDTAINFIQNNGTPNYATARDELNENWKDKEVKGKDGQTIKTENDVQKLETGKTTSKSNIFDMGGNITEFTTEVMPSANKPIILRGGDYYGLTGPAGQRYSNSANRADGYAGFRSTLFLK